jgi:hypoxanthine phosphoribosyltransferase
MGVKTMNNDILKVLISEQEIKEICARLGAEITKDYQGKDLVVVGLLKGCNPFMADLIRHIELKLDVDYLAVSSYQGTQSSGDIKIRLDLNESIKDRDVLIAEDIVDTGTTLTTVKKLLLHRGARSVKIVTLLDKPEGRIIECDPDYIGTKVPNEFVVGYGLDYNEKYRNLPYIGVLKPAAYQK